MKTEVEYLLENGLAKPSCSPWSSPCLLVTKGDGSARFCTDYLKINALTVPDCFPLPCMEDCMDTLGPARFVSKLDLLKGYWQVYQNIFLRYFCICNPRRLHAVLRNGIWYAQRAGYISKTD